MLQKLYIIMIYDIHYTCSTSCDKNSNSSNWHASKVANSGDVDVHPPTLPDQAIRLEHGRETSTKNMGFCWTSEISCLLLLRVSGTVTERTGSLIQLDSPFHKGHFSR